MPANKLQQNKPEILRHSTAHVLAAAVLEMFPEAKFGMGPAIENGFYYDFELPRTLIPEDLPILEDKMRTIIKAKHKFEQAEMDTSDAVEHFKKLGQGYKVEIINDIIQNSKFKIQNSEVCVYTQGSFVDLCSGPHLDSTGEINPHAFKLTKISGAYWKGDEKNAQLQRIYGVVFESKDELKAYLQMLAEAEKRDHKKIGRELDIFMNHEAAPGMPFFLPKGMIILTELLKFVRTESYGSGYQEVKTPQLLNSELWKTSGHWDHYKEDMFCLHHAEDDTDIGIKPMNCPAHMLIFKRDMKSYRDLPLRIAETTTLYRNERSGTLHGLTRVRSLSQDDTHIFCTQEHIQSEIGELLEKIKRIYKIFDLTIDEINLSTRPEKYMGEKETWDLAENNLKEALEKANLKYELNAGDGAFYGPKIDVKVKDAIGRQWQLATIQLDFQLPLRFDLSYINSAGEHTTPIVIHRALLGSMERFLGILIEHYAGVFPLWLSPVQAMVIPVSEEKFGAYALEVKNKLVAGGVRAEVDASSESLGKRIRNAEKQKIPYMLVVGEKEKESDSVAVRSREDKNPASAKASAGKQEVMKVDKFMEKVKREIIERK